MFLTAPSPASGQIVPNAAVDIDIVTIIILIAVIVFAVALAQLFLIVLRTILQHRSRSRMKKLSAHDLD